MLRTAFLVDGFNLYHSTRQASNDLKLQGFGTRWLDLRRLFRTYLPTIRGAIGSPVDLTSIHYFSAYANHLDPSKAARHRVYVRALQSSGVQIEMGRFKPKEVWCSACKKSARHWEVKESDVAISVRLAEIVLRHSCDVAVLATGDTDLAPAVRMVHQLAPAVKIGFAFPYKRKNKELANLADFSFVMSKENYQTHQFPDLLILADDIRLSKPNAW